MTLASDMSNLRIAEHPLTLNSLAVLRSRTTDTAAFRRHAAIVSRILLIEATRDMALKPANIETPLAPMEAQVLAEEAVVVPVLRAGLAMLFAVQDFLLDVPVGFLGLERDEETAVAREYYQKLPPRLEGRRVLILDPMLATGGSLDETVSAVSRRKTGRIILVCIVAAPEGVRRLAERHPDVQIVTAALDERLDDRKFIVPGLGDFGDRYFGT